MKVKVISLPYIFQVLYFTRPRHQVSVYRTIGTLVFPRGVANLDPRVTIGRNYKGAY